MIRNVSIVNGQTDRLALPYSKFTCCSCGLFAEALLPANGSFLFTVRLSSCLTWGAIHQLLSIIHKLRILVLLPVSTMPYVVIFKNYS
jgi:hypothetical protein